MKFDSLRVYRRTQLLGDFSGTRPVEPGDHVNTPDGWGRVAKVVEHKGEMYVYLAGREEWLEKQDFPEWDLMQRAEKQVEARRAEGGWRI